MSRAYSSRSARQQQRSARPTDSRQPGTGNPAAALTRSIAQAATAAELVATVQQQGKRFNSLHIAATLHRAAKLLAALQAADGRAPPAKVGCLGPPVAPTCRRPHAGGSYGPSGEHVSYAVAVYLALACTAWASTSRGWRRESSRPTPPLLLRQPLPWRKHSRPTPPTRPYPGAGWMQDGVASAQDALQLQQLMLKLAAPFARSIGSYGLPDLTACLGSHAKGSPTPTHGGGLLGCWEGRRHALPGVGRMIGNPCWPGHGPDRSGVMF